MIRNPDFMAMQSTVRSFLFTPRRKFFTIRMPLGTIVLKTTLENPENLEFRMITLSEVGLELYDRQFIVMKDGDKSPDNVTIVGYVESYYEQMEWYHIFDYVDAL